MHKYMYITYIHTYICISPLNLTKRPYSHHPHPNAGVLWLARGHHMHRGLAFDSGSVPGGRSDNSH